MQNLELKIPPLVLVLITAALMWVIASTIPVAGLAFPFAAFVAIGLVICGLGIAALGVLEFRSAGTTVDPRFPDQAASLVVRGIYRISRNPMYLGFLLVLAAWGVFLSSVLAFVVLPLFVFYMNRFQIQPEERYMRDKFGTAYREYSNSVRQWI